MATLSHTKRLTGSSEQAVRSIRAGRSPAGHRFGDFHRPRTLCRVSIHGAHPARHRSHAHRCHVIDKRFNC